MNWTTKTTTKTTTPLPEPGNGRLGVAVSAGVKTTETGKIFDHNDRLLVVDETHIGLKMRFFWQGFFADMNLVDEEVQALFDLCKTYMSRAAERKLEDAEPR